jgi:hypothetical protein
MGWNTAWSGRSVDVEQGVRKETEVTEDGRRNGLPSEPQARLPGGEDRNPVGSGNDEVAIGSEAGEVKPTVGIAVHKGQLDVRARDSRCMVGVGRDVLTYELAEISLDLGVKSVSDHS